jgi:hypothetical protein
MRAIKRRNADAGLNFIKVAARKKEFALNVDARY